MKASLNRVSRARPRWLSAAWFARVEEAAAGLRPAREAVNVVIVDDREIRRLNRRYRGKDKPTDVLSFSYRDDPGPRDGTAGDIYVSLDTLARDARRLGVDVSHLALRIVVHGMLHVIGYDHENDADAARMERRERAVLKRILPAADVRKLF
ncbi:MAG TPA: rRNA maturation RNase YbeY [Candidatus Krumholzibacteria bacterium]|nr:rRNA maturation RNase YbeY [Candidatus Krumholzibacteria bacterium]